MLNRAIMIGRLCADPELKHTQTQVAVCSFRIAVDRDYSKNGDKEGDIHRHKDSGYGQPANRVTPAQRLSINLWASACPPLISKVKMEAPPLGKYFSYRA